MNPENPISPNDPSNEALALAMSIIETTGANLFLTGKAGTGKTTFLRRLRETSSKRIVVLAPTGIAAINAGGMTIHSFFQLSFAPYIPGMGFSGSQKRYDRFSREKLKVIRSMDILVIDEISMVRADLLDAVDSALRRHRDPERPFGGVQLLLIGDLAQLPPVVKEDEWQMLSQYYSTPFFFSSIALSQATYETVELTKVYRQNETEFLDILNRIREDNVDYSTMDRLNRRHIPDFNPPASQHWIRLVTHNAQARAINEAALEALPDPAFSFEAEVSGDFPETSYPADSPLVLKKGSRVMFIKNDSSGSHLYYNGMLGIVSGISDSKIIVTPADGGAPIDVSPEIWTNNKYVVDAAASEMKEEVIGEFSQFPLRKAWAITIHKSQGLTFDRACIDATSSFTHGQTYVALSRCRTLEGLVLERPLSFSALRSDPTVAGYLRDRAGCRPDRERISTLQQTYQATLLDDLFCFRQLVNAIDRMQRLMLSEFQSSRPALVRSWTALYDLVKRNLNEVSLRFSHQYRSMIIDKGLATDSPEVDDRIRKGAGFFLDILYEIQRILVKTPKENDNKETTKRLKRIIGEIRDEILIKDELLRYIVANGLSTAAFLNAKAKAMVAAEESDAQLRKRMMLLVARNNKEAAKATSAAGQTSTGKTASGTVSSHTEADTERAALAQAEEEARKEQAAEKPKSENKAQKIKISLDDEGTDVRDEQLFQRLRIWRKATADKIGKPAYIVMPNKTLLNIVNADPATPEELLSVKGMGQNKFDLYGEELLLLLGLYRQSHPAPE